MMVSGGITKDGLSKSKVYLCEVSSLIVKANSILCVQYSKWIISTRAGVMRETPTFSRNFACKKCEWDIGEAVEQEKSYVMKRKHIYLTSHI